MLNLDNSRLIEALERSEQFNQAVLNSIPVQIAVLNTQGTIIQVNGAWQRFVEANGPAELINAGVGTNYLAFCQAVFGLSEAQVAKCSAGLQALLDDSIQQFDFEYACNAAAEECWFMMRAVALPEQESGFVVSHFDISPLKQVEKSLEQRNRDLALLNRSSQVFISTLDLDQVLTVILEEVRHLLMVLACSAWLVDAPTGELVCRQVTEPQGKAVRGWRLKPGQGLAGWTVQHGRSVIVPDAFIDERHFKGVDQQTGLNVRSILTVPLWVKQQVIGVLQVIDTQVNRFSEMDVVLLESLAATAAVAIENARLYEQARRDAETKEALLHEVNHRVKNNLAAIVGLLYAEQRHVGLEDQTVYQTILNGLVNRVQGLATVHKMLSASEWEPLRLSELVRQIIRSSLQVLPRDKHVSVEVSPSRLKVTADQAHNLALIINELVTNTMRHALTERSAAHIKVEIRLKDGFVQLEFRDDGPGYPEEVLRLERHGVGFELIQPLVYKSLRGQLSLRNDSGAVTVIQFNSKLKAGKAKSNERA
jgi:two-component sensor histidine kinase